MNRHFNIMRRVFSIRLLIEALTLLVVLAMSPMAMAQQCSNPVNLASNGSFDSGLSGYSSVTRWLFNQTLNPVQFGTVYNTRPAVQNPSAAPTNAALTAYPAASLNAFIINEDDNVTESITITNPSGNYVSHFSGALHIWFDMGWRHAGGSTSTASTLQVKVNGTTYMAITTLAGNAAGNATGTVSNGASLGTGTPTTYANSGGSGTVSQWNTIHLIVPYSGASLPTVSFAMVAGGGISDDFAIDRLFVPICQVSAITVTKGMTIISDPANGTNNPKAIPGATVRYCIRVTNTASNPTATSINITDNLNGQNATFVPSSIRVNGTVSSGECVWNGSAGGSFSGGIVTASLSSLVAGATATVYFDVTLN